MPILYLDLESYCEVPITDGTYKYAMSAEVMLIAYALEDGPVKVLDMTDHDAIEQRREVSKLLLDPSMTFVIHNSMFDRNVLRFATGIHLPVERIHDTMIQAYCHSLPGALGDLCDIFNVNTDKAKDKEGFRYIQRFCKPQKVGNIVRCTRETHPKEWAGFIEYAKRDVESMRIIRDKMPMWNYGDADRKLWALDQRINDRGITIDRELVDAAMRAVEKEQKRLGKRAQTLTLGDLDATRQRNKLLAHLENVYGLVLPDLQASTVERRLADENLPDTLRELLANRLQSTTSSTAKYKKFAKSVNKDGKLRGLLQFRGAARTGRWGGRLVQPQNLPRPTISHDDIDFGIRVLKADVLDMFNDNVMEVCSSAVRGVLTASPGKKLVIADLANIEGRVAAWVTEESWKIKAFRDYDNGEGADLYKVAFARAFNVPVESVTKDQRQIGKVMELMLQYAGGVGAFITGADSYGIDLDSMAERAWASLPLWAKEEAEGWYHNTDNHYGLSKKTFIVCDALKRLWRQTHPHIVSMWKDIETAVWDVMVGAKSVQIGRYIRIDKQGNWLRIRLPSGRYLCYAAPKMEDSQLTYMGVNQTSHKWSRLKTYGGKLFENIVQAIAVDVLAYGGVELAEEHQFEVLLTVHDESITEVPESRQHAVKMLEELMSTCPDWAQGLPLAASGFETFRYRKD